MRHLLDWSIPFGEEGKLIHNKRTHEEYLKATGQRVLEESEFQEAIRIQKAEQEERRMVESRGGDYHEYKMQQKAEYDAARKAKMDEMGVSFLELDKSTAKDLYAQSVPMLAPADIPKVEIDSTTGISEPVNLVAYNEARIREVEATPMPPPPEGVAM
jgi:hypothetical protein